MSTFLQVSRRPISRYSDVSLSSSVALFAVYDFLGHVSFSTLPTLFAHPDFKIKSTNCYRAISQVFTIKSNMIASFKPLNLLFLTLPWSSRRALHCKHMYVRMTVTFIQPWYKALRSSRSSGTLNTVVSSINACIYLIAQTFEYSNCKTSWDCFSIGTQIFSHLLYRTFSLKNVASIVTQFDLLSYLFSACKSKKEIKGVFQVYLEIHSQSASATCCYA